MENKPNSQSAMKNWKRSIKKTMTDGFALVKCAVDSSSTAESGEQASVEWRHLAISQKDNIMYPGNYVGIYIYIYII